MQKISDFLENMKKLKMGLNDWILDFEGAKSIRESCSLILFFFLRFSGKVSEQYDQVARKPGFCLRIANNDLKHKDES